MEKRENSRFKVQIWAEEKGQDYTCFHLVSNLSCSGFFIEKKLPFSTGSVIHFELELFDPNEKLRIKGLIKNVYKDSESNITGTGVKFVEMSKENKKKLENYLKQIETKQ